MVEAGNFQIVVHILETTNITSDIFYTVAHNKRDTMLFWLLYLRHCYAFCTSGNRNKYNTVYLLNSV